PAQNQAGYGDGVIPNHLATGQVKGGDLPVLSLEDSTVAVAGRNRQDFAGQGHMPEQAAVGGGKRHRLTIAGAEQHLVVTGMKPTGNTEPGFHFPLPLAGVARKGGDAAIGVGSKYQGAGSRRPQVQPYPII